MINTMSHITKAVRSMLRTPLRSMLSDIGSKSINKRVFAVK